MFLCPPCHEEGHPSQDERVAEFGLLGRSFGACEHCRTVGYTVNCQRYNFSEHTEEEIEAAIERLEAALEPHTRYFVTRGAGPEREVSMEEFMDAERDAGFVPTRPGRPATAGFSTSANGGIRGRTTIDQPSSTST